jgi:hypothetical protein
MGRKAKVEVSSENQENNGDLSTLDDIIDQEFDKLVDISKFDTTVKTWYDVGIYSLNYICSKNLFGAVPSGRVTSFKGLSGTAKSMLMAQIAKDPKVDKIIVINSEGGGLSAELFKFIGAPLDKVRMQGFNTFTNYRISKSSGKFEEVPDSEFPGKTETNEYIYVEGITRFVKRFVNAIEFRNIKSNIVILIDSLANIRSVRELNGVSDFGSKIKEVNTFFGIFDNAFQKTNIALVFSNKLYNSMSGNMWEPFKESGGESVIYNPSLSVLLKETSLTEDKTDEEMKEEKERRKTALGSSLKAIKAIVDKSRFGTELRNITFLVDLNYGPVKLSGLFELCRDFGILERKGNSYTMPDVIDKPFFKKEFIPIIASDEVNYINKIQKKLEEAEEKIKQDKVKLQVSDIEEIEEVENEEKNEYEIGDLAKNMEADL